MTQRSIPTAPATPGQATMANSAPVVLASDQSAVPTSSLDLGAKADVSATTDVGAFSLIALLKRLLSKFQVFTGPSANFVQVGTVNQVASGTLTLANDAVTIGTDSLGSVSVNLSGANAGATVVFEGLVAGSTWDVIKVYPLTVGAAGVTAVSTAGDYEFNCASFRQVRARLSVAGSGSFTATVNGTAAAKHIGVKNANAVDLNATVTVAPAFTPTGNTGAGSVTSANTDQTVLAANTTRRMSVFQNTHATATIYLNFGAVAWTGSALTGLQVGPGQGVVFDIQVPNSALHAASATAGATFFILEG